MRKLTSSRDKLERSKINLGKKEREKIQIIPNSQKSI